jgi:1-phosphofructokinase
MIYTITLNPAIDKIILMSQDLELKKTNYYHDEYSVVGGKGINVGVVLNNLNEDVQLTGILGKNNPDVFEKKFEILDLKNHFFANDGNTRTNYKIKNLKTNQETELNGEGFETDPAVLQQLLQYLTANIQPHDIVVATGSIPKNVPKNIYQQIGTIVKEKNGLFIVDAAKEALQLALEAQPFLIKPNIDELNDVFQLSNVTEELDSLQQLITTAQSKGARNILLSMGAKGSYYFSEQNEIYQVGIAQGQLVNSVGAGDSMLAGFIHGLAQQYDVSTTLKYAAACGGATAFTTWLATKDEIEPLVGTIQVTKIK